jgi:hypothetical protein
MALVAHDATHGDPAPPGHLRQSAGVLRSAPTPGSPTLTSISTSGTPATAAASMIGSASTAMVTRTPPRTRSPRRVASTTSLAKSRSSDNPTRAIPSISAMVAQVKAR